MKASKIVARGAALAGPFVVLAIPKCPLCLLPLLAAAGIALPSGPLLDAIVIAVVTLWAAIVSIVAASARIRVLSLLAAAMIIAGRLTSIVVLSWLGIALMISIAAIRLLARERICKQSCERTI